MFITDLTHTCVWEEGKKKQPIGDNLSYLLIFFFFVTKKIDNLFVVIDKDKKWTGLHKRF